MGVDFLAAVAHRPRPGARTPKVMVFDSGVGGLSVAREVRRLMPATEIVYVADDAAFPYGDWPEPALTARLAEILPALVAEHAPEAVVIACNTASTLALPVLRSRVALPIVGTVPAIKPAAERSASGMISVLATPGTVAREYTRGLIAAHARGVEVNLVGSLRLATLAEARLRGWAIDTSAVEAEIRPCFLDRCGRRTDAVVLACTHYPFLLDVFRRLAPWPVAWIDPAEAIARRTQCVLGREEFSEEEPPGERSPPTAGPGRLVLTSGRRPEPALIAAFARHGITPAA